MIDKGCCKTNLNCHIFMFAISQLLHTRSSKFVCLPPKIMGVLWGVDRNYLMIQFEEAAVLHTWKFESLFFWNTLLLLQKVETSNACKWLNLFCICLRPCYKITNHAKGWPQCLFYLGWWRSLNQFRELMMCPGHQKRWPRLQI